MTWHFSRVRPALFRIKLIRPGPGFSRKDLNRKKGGRYDQRQKFFEARI
jgi:hypothetical protein